MRPSPPTQPPPPHKKARDHPNPPPPNPTHPTQTHPTHPTHPTPPTTHPTDPTHPSPPTHPHPTPPTPPHNVKDFDTLPVSRRPLSACSSCLSSTWGPPFLALSQSRALSQCRFRLSLRAGFLALSQGRGTLSVPLVSVLSQHRDALSAPLLLLALSQSHTAANPEQTPSSRKCSQMLSQRTRDDKTRLKLGILVLGCNLGLISEGQVWGFIPGPPRLRF